MTSDNRLGDDLLSCTMSSRVNFRMREHLPQVSSESDLNDVSAYHDIACAQLGMLDACVAIAFDSQGRDLTQDEEQAVRHALEVILVSEYGAPDELAPKVVQHVMDNLYDDGGDTIMHKWGDKMHEYLHENEFRVAKLRSFAKSGKVFNPATFNNPLEISRMAIEDKVEEMRMAIEEMGRMHGVKSPTKQGCFIATACYGDYDAPEVQVLREFRDRHLLSSKVGYIIVSAYYSISPGIACKLRRHPNISQFIKTRILNPIVEILKVDKWNK